MKYILSLLIALSCAAQAQTPPKYIVTVIAPGQGTGINSQGDVVGTLSANDHAFLFTHGKLRDLGTVVLPNGKRPVFSHVVVNDSDQIACEVLAEDTPTSPFTGLRALNAFVWKSGVFKQFAYGASDDGPDPAQVFAINNSGEVVGSFGGYTGQGTPAPGARVYFDSSYSAYVYRNGKLYEFGTLGGVNSIAYGINNAGQIVGTADGNGATLAFLYTNNRMQAIGGSESSN